jgi:hypothetical protein
VIELMSELIEKCLAWTINMVAFLPPWVCKKTPLLSRLAVNMEALEKFPASSTLIGYEKTPFLCSKSSDSASL